MRDIGVGKCRWRPVGLCSAKATTASKVHWTLWNNWQGAEVMMDILMGFVALVCLVGPTIVVHYLGKE